MMRRIICGPCGSSWSSVDYTANRWSLSGEAPCVLENVSKHLCSVFETLIEGCSTCTWLCKYMSTVLVSCWCSWTLISQMFECWIQWICISIFFFLIELSSETTMVHRTTISVKNIYELFFFFQWDYVCADLPLHPGTALPVLRDDHDGKEGGQSLG